MIKIKNKADCSGCGACQSLCPVGAIAMRADGEGFLYPEVKTDKCVRCGKCVSLCPATQNRTVRNDREGTAYAAMTNDEQIRMSSSSGGIFSEIAGYILRLGGVVFGAAYDENFKLVHIGIENISDLDRLRGSKYVQSEIGQTYKEAESYLKEGRTVLFSGTPCQIGGLYSFLGRDYDNLYTQDIICHGVPSPLLWKKYIEFREAKAGAKTRRTFFRHKKYGWKMYSVQFIYENCTEYIQIIRNDLYMQSFLQNLCLRPSCYDCSFKSLKRDSDITLADFWGVENIYPEMDDNGGTSLIIVNSEKGASVFDNIAENLKFRKADLTEAVKYNQAMIKSVSVNPKRDDFIKDINEKGFCGAKKYVRVPFGLKIKRLIKDLYKTIRSK